MGVNGELVEGVGKIEGEDDGGVKEEEGKEVEKKELSPEE